MLKKEITISSTDFYKRHNRFMFCCWAYVKDGKVTSLWHETGREGGQLWSSKCPEDLLWSLRYTEDLQKCLSSLGRDFGIKFYAAVHKAAYRENLLTPLEASRQINQRLIELAKRRLKLAEEVYKNEKAGLEKLERKVMK